MKRTLILISLLTFTIIAFSQNQRILAKAVLKSDISKKFPEGSVVNIIKVGEINSSTDFMVIELNGHEKRLDVNEIVELEFTFDDAASIWRFYKARQEKHFEYNTKYSTTSIRHTLTEYSDDFIRMLEDYNLFYTDDYITDYIYQLVTQIFPPDVKVASKNNIVIKIMKDNVPNAFMCANGTLVLSSGLLTLVESEDELAGILAHEVAHFVLDHSVYNVRDELILEDRADFWAGVATLAAAVGEGIVAANNEYYVPGNITNSVMLLSYSIAHSTVERLGQKYQQYQELEADHCAIRVLEYLGRDPAAYTALLLRLRDYNIDIGNLFAFTNEGTHPSINVRISKGLPVYSLDDFYDSKYIKRISSLSTYVANLELSAGHFNKCMNLSLNNVNEGVAVEEDYYLLAKSLMCISNSDSTNNVALTHLKTGLTLDVEYIPELDKQLALLYLRMDDIPNAVQHIDEYITQVEAKLENSEEIHNEVVWAYFQQYYLEELSWSNRLKYKMNKL